MNKKIALLLPILLLPLLLTAEEKDLQTPIKCQWSDTSTRDMYCDVMPPEKKAYFIVTIRNNDEYNNYRGSVPSLYSKKSCTLYQVEQQEKINHELVYGGRFESAKPYNPYVYYMCKEDWDAIQPSLREGKDFHETLLGIFVPFPKKIENTMKIIIIDKQKNKNRYIYQEYLQTVHFKLREAVKTTPPTKD